MLFYLCHPGQAPTDSGSWPSVDVVLSLCPCDVHVLMTHDIPADSLSTNVSSLLEHPGWNSTSFSRKELCDPCCTPYPHPLVLSIQQIVNSSSSIDCISEQTLSAIPKKSLSLFGKICRRCSWFAVQNSQVS